MTEWRKVKLGDICSIKSGKRLPKGADFSLYPTDYKYIRARDIKNGSINDENLAYISQDVQERIAKYIVNTNDVVVTIVGASVGDVAFVSPKFDGINLTENAVRLTDFDEHINPQYIFYLLNTKEFFDLMQRVAGGAAQPKLGIYKIEAITVEVPSISIQNHIVRVLSRYDALIEIYQRQIKLLEEAAQRLYKEWFVDLRFPGHQSTPIINNLPQGWQKKKLGEIADVNCKSISKDYPFDFVDYIDLGAVREGHIEKPTRYLYGEEPGRAKRVASDGDIIWGMVRPNLKAYALVQNPKRSEVFSTGFSIITARDVPFSFLYCAVTTEAFVGYLVNCTNGAAYPAVKAEHFEKADLIIPSKMVLDNFHQHVGRMYRTIGYLQTQIRNLSEARDRLLPKLMSAEIEV